MKVSKLYKYLDIDGGLAMLSNSNLQFTNATRLNDPFDCHPSLIDFSNVPDERMRAWGKDLVMKAESGIKASVLSETINGKRSVSLSVAVAIEKVLGVPADVLMNMQTQYDLDTANIASRSNEKETVEVIIPVRDRDLLKEIARKLAHLQKLGGLSKKFSQSI